MKMINELETEKRNVYAGAVGYISFSGNMDMSPLIRLQFHPKSIAIEEGGTLIREFLSRINGQ